ncbi:MAG: hypothetical protein IJ007_03635 [Oscillospiraceae bacterium]|nr:hypothetical protein [Oscillospiraceae bacterium]
MDRHLTVTSGDDIVFEGSTAEVTELLSAGNDFTRNDIEGAFEWLYENYGDTDGGITADVTAMINSTDTLDGLGTRALFWIAALMMKTQTLSKLPLPCVFKLIPFIQRKTAVHGAKMQKVNDTSEAFLKLYKEISEQLSAGEKDEDTALTEILRAMPEKDIIEFKLETDPQFKDVFQSIEKMSRSCKDEKIKKLTEKVLKEFNSGGI